MESLLYGGSRRARRGAATAVRAALCLLWIGWAATAAPAQATAATSAPAGLAAPEPTPGAPSGPAAAPTAEAAPASAAAPADGPASERLLAFPGAEGAGRYAWGGRGGAVYHVTTLADHELPGSLRWAVGQSGARTVVFDVCGDIMLRKPLRIDHDSLTIAGQTAPGDGICISRYGLVIMASDVVVRYVRARVGCDMRDQENDAISVLGKGANPLHDIIIDHCTASWSVDECLSAYGVRGLTVQWCFINESLFNSGHAKGTHGYGVLLGGAPASFHHNLVAHHTARTPRLTGSRFSGDEAGERVDIRNNVFYNWGPVNSGYGGYGGQFNFVANYYKPGPRTLRTREADRRGRHERPATSLVTRIFQPQPDPGDYVQRAGVWGRFYAADNHIDDTVEGINDEQREKCRQVNRDNRKGIQPKEKDSPLPEGGKAAILMDGPWAADDVATQSADEAMRRVLRWGGCSLRRDTADRRVVREVREGTWTHVGSTYRLPIRLNAQGDAGPNLTSNYGIIDTPTDVGGWPELRATAEERAAARADANGNGIPDAWEQEHCGMMVDGAGHDMDPRYTNLEWYMNALVDHITRGQQGQ